MKVEEKEERETERVKRRAWERERKEEKTYQKGNFY